MAATGLAALAIAATASLAGCASVPLAQPTVAAPLDLSWPGIPLAPDSDFEDVARTQACPMVLGAHGPLQVLLQDRRIADVAVFVVANDAELGSCLVQTGGVGPTGGGGSKPRPTDDVSGVSVDVGGGDLLDRGLGYAMHLGGRAGPRISKVTIFFASGNSVQASVGGGYWLASWHGTERAARVVAADADGAIVATIEDPK